MKKIAFTLIMLAGILQVKAQNLVLPANPLYQFRLQTPANNWNSLSIKPKTDTAAYIKKLLEANKTAMIIYGRMPVVKLNNTDLKMPIVQTDKTGYTMPVVGSNVSGLYYMKKPGDSLKRAAP